MSIYNSSFGILRIRELLKKVREEGLRVHFIGVLGAGQRGLAGLLLSEGIRVSGSDVKGADEAAQLISSGLEYYPTQEAENVKDAALAVYTLAIHHDNPEYAAARAEGIPAVSRAELAAAISAEYQNVITVAGSHGKSTVTAMLAHVFQAAKEEPTVLSGAALPSGEHAIAGKKEFFILEACEYKDSFLKFRPSCAIINNIELDHTDYFSGLPAVMRSFSKYASRTKDIVLLNCDDDNAAKITVPSDKRVVTFGAQESSDYRYILVSVGGERSIFSVASSAHGDLGEFRINVPGIFNISNATAVIATAMEYGLDPEKIREGIASFHGIARRLEYIGEYRSRAVFYDYAHHPTEILQGIAALRSMGHDPITVVFGPHTYSRTADLFSDFARALSFADYSLICDIYAAREENIYGVSSVALAEKTGENSYYASVENIKEHLDNLTRGTVIIMGAADMSMVLSAMNLKK